MKITEREFVQKIAHLPFVDEIWLYGSRARGSEKNRSDVDLAIVCPRPNEHEWQQILAIIEDSDTLLKIDCVRFDSVKQNSLFYNEIVQDRKLIYTKNSGFMQT
ncbi:MAG TPA: nucleotidyltransferase domain-containing protein, partial [Chlamydiales bacterium]|nr:nucleotidyltransferase domain-containing protein [Chlamydiales bacterium]